MEFSNSWRVLTTAGWVRLWAVSPLDPLPDEGEAAVRGAQRARFHLLSELEAGGGAVRHALRELWDFLEGGARLAGAGWLHADWTDREIEAVTSVLLRALRTKRVALELEPWPPSLTGVHVRDLSPPDLPPPGRPPRDPSFIAVHLLDQRDEPVVGRRYIIELPDGSRHEGVTDQDGWGRVAGFTEDGTAKVIFPEFDEIDFKTKGATDKLIVPVEGDEPPDEAEEEEEDATPEDEPAEPETPEPDRDGVVKAGNGAHFVEFNCVDQEGEPLARVRYALTTSEGKTIEGTTDAEGFARVEGIDGEDAKLELLDRAGEEWSVA
ncbi:MAG TPA: hypothetical protein VGQ57_19240 [Polyangiaceae bacterium]|nr:hypothetical protein [Polyangiaceae bacterium]